MQVRLLTVYSTTVNNSEVPQVRIQGKWLERLGFKPNVKIIVEEKYGQLLLRIVQICEAGREGTLITGITLLEFPQFICQYV